MIEIQLTGWDGINKMLKGVPDKLQNRALKSAVRQGANIVRDTARMMAPERLTEYPPARTASFSLRQWGIIERAGGTDTGHLKSGKHRKGVKSAHEFRKPGTLKRSIQVGEPPRYANTLKKLYGARNITELAAGIRRRAYYGIFFEGEKGFTDRGGRHHESRPFLRKALADYADAILITIRNVLSTKLKDIERSG